MALLEEVALSTPGLQIPMVGAQALAGMDIGIAGGGAKQEQDSLGLRRHHLLLVKALSILQLQALVIPGLRQQERLSQHLQEDTGDQLVPGSSQGS